MPDFLRTPLRLSLLKASEMKRIQRWQETRISSARASRRVLLLEGARQCGKTTLARGLPGKWHYRTLDDAASMDALAYDLKAFVRHEHDMMIIDEVQHAPQLLPEIKRVVDDDPRPGQYLLTGSAHVQSLPGVVESLAGRVAHIRLRPFAQAELFGKAPDFLHDLVSNVSFSDQPDANRQHVIQAAMRGGYPEVQAFDHRQRSAWHRDYVDAILNRDLQDVGRVVNRRGLRNLLSAAAAWSCRISDSSAMSRELSVARNSVETWLGLLETLFLFERLPAWARTDYKRIGKRDKWMLTDSGLVSSLLRYPDDPARLNDDQVGKIVELLVACELLALADASDDRFLVSHYRDNEKREIDFMIDDEDTGGAIGIEVKASTTVGARDFRHLRWFVENLSENRPFVGVVLYCGTDVLHFGDNLMAIPITLMWRPTDNQVR